MFLAAHTRWRSAFNALPFAAILPIVMAIASLMPYDLGRSFFILPALGCLSVVGLLTLAWPKRFGLIEAISSSLGLYLGVIFFELLLIHPELATSGNLKGVISLGLGWSVFVVLTQMTPSDNNLRWIERSLVCLTLILAAQIWVSYFTGWGEVHDTRDGVRRAFGMAGDNLTLALVFLILWAFLRKKWVLGTTALSALMMTGGRLSLAVLLLCFSLLIAALPATQKVGRRITIGAFVLALFFSVGAVQAGRWITLPTANALPAQTEAPQLVTLSPSPAPAATPPVSTNTPSPAPVAVPVTVYVPPSDPEAFLGPKPFWQRMANLYGASALGTLRGRLITFGAGLDMFLRAPLTGIGFGQSTALFQDAAYADRLNLKAWAGALDGHFQAEKFIANQYILTAAEQGLIGLVPLLAFALCGLLICIKAYRALYHQADLSAPRPALALAGCLWAGSLIVAGQTVSWFLPASPQALWFGFALGLATLSLRDDTSQKAAA